MNSVWVHMQKLPRSPSRVRSNRIGSHRFLAMRSLHSWCSRWDLLWAKCRFLFCFPFIKDVEYGCIHCLLSVMHYILYPSFSHFFLVMLLCVCFDVKALDGFFIVMLTDGNIIYVSESITSLLEHLPVSR